LFGGGGRRGRTGTEPSQTRRVRGPRSARVEAQGGGRRSPAAGGASGQKGGPGGGAGGSAARLRGAAGRNLAAYSVGFQPCPGGMRIGFEPSSSRSSAMLPFA
jgi:hypothetical protein